MDLNEYLWRNKKSQREFAEEIGVCEVTICKLKNYSNIPNLRTALLIHKHTGGEVSLIELIPCIERSKYKVKEKQL